MRRVPSTQCQREPSVGARKSPSFHGVRPHGGRSGNRRNTPAQSLFPSFATFAMSPLNQWRRMVTVHKMRESDAGQLSPVQASKLVRVLELEACWRGMKVRSASDTSLDMLRARQVAFDAYNNALMEYARKHSQNAMPEVIRSGPKGIATWCRVMRAIFRQAEFAENTSPIHLIAKGFQMAERIAELRKIEPIRPGDAPTGLSDAINNLDEIIAWCAAATIAI